MRCCDRSATAGRLVFVVSLATPREWTRTRDSVVAEIVVVADAAASRANAGDCQGSRSEISRLGDIIKDNHIDISIQEKA
jgi:hypothetical protein